MITAYDATFARIVDESGVDMILVGDSVGSVVQGVANTIPVTLEEMEYHVKLVARANPRALILVIFPSVLTRSIRNRLFAVRFAS